MAKIYLSNSTNPYENLALEQHLTFNTQGRVLYLWQNADTVVIGNHQNAWAECDLVALEADGGRLARRTTGGGAVFHDLGNLNFSFITDEEDFSAAENLAIIADALATLGIKAQATGRNDLTVDGAKISGNAFLHRQGRALHHGTLLVKSDMARLGKYLTVHPKKLSAKGVKSVRSRVANLADVCPGITVDMVKDAIINKYTCAYACEICPAPDVSEYKDAVLHFGSKEFLLGKNPSCTINMDERFEWGMVSVGIDAKGDVARGVAVFTDALDLDVAPMIKDALTGAALNKDALCAIGQKAERAEVKDVISALISQLF